MSKTLQCLLVGLIAASAGLEASEILNLSANDASSLTVVGGQVMSWQNTGTAGGTFTAAGTASPTLVTNATPNGSSALLFNGSTNVLEDATFGQTITQGTIFLVVTPLSNPGGYSAFFSGIDASAPGHQDYNSGINIDQGSGSSSSFSTLNTESAYGGGGGGDSIKTDSSPFGTFQVLAITVNNSASTLYVDGTQENSRGNNGSTTASISLNDVRIGARYYDNGGGPYQTGYLDGYVADVEVFNTVLSGTDLTNESNALMNEYINPAAPPSTVPEPAYLPATGLLMLAGAFLLRRQTAGTPVAK